MQYGVAVRGVHPQHHFLQRRADGQRGERLRQLRPVPARHRPRWTDVEHDPVGGGPVAFREAGERLAHGGQRQQAHEFQPGIADPAGRVGDRDQVAYLGEREQPVVGRVVVRDAVEQVHVLGRGQPVQREVAQPPQVQPLGEHRVQVAVQRLLDEAALRLAVGQVLGAQVLGYLAGGRHRDVQPPQWTVEPAVGEQLPYLAGEGVDAGQVALPPGEQVDDHPAVRVGRREVRRHRAGEPGQLRQRRERGDQVDPLSLDVVVGGADEITVVHGEVQRTEVAGAVVAPGVDLQEHLVEPRVVAAPPVPQEHAP